MWLEQKIYTYREEINYKVVQWIDKINGEKLYVVMITNTEQLLVSQGFTP